MKTRDIEIMKPIVRLSIVKKVKKKRLFGEKVTAPSVQFTNYYSDSLVGGGIIIVKITNS